MQCVQRFGVNWYCHIGGVEPSKFTTSNNLKPDLRLPCVIVFLDFACFLLSGTVDDLIE